jgi:hypothetical protein
MRIESLMSWEVDATRFLSAALEPHSRAEGAWKEEEMPKSGRYFVERSKGEWAMSSNGRTIRRFTTKRQAVKAARSHLVIK